MYCSPFWGCKQINNKKKIIISVVIWFVFDLEVIKVEFMIILEMLNLITFDSAIMKLQIDNEAPNYTKMPYASQ